MQMTKNLPGALLASFVSQTESTPALTLITGPRGAGKTIWCTDLIGRAHARGLNVRGLISPSVFEAGQKIGIDLKDLQTGEQRHLAYRKGAAGGDVQTQDWQLVAETLDWGNSVLERIDTGDLFILDELGSFEFEHGMGLVEGIHIIDSLKKFPCVVVIRQSLISVARKRWPWAHLLDVSSEAA